LEFLTKGDFNLIIISEIFYFAKKLTILNKACETNKMTLSETSLSEKLQIVQSESDLMPARASPSLIIRAEISLS